MNWVKGSGVYPGILETQQWSHFFSDSKELKRPHMCYIFEKHGIQGYQIYIKCKIHKYTNTLIHKYKVLKRPNMCYIFEKHGFQGYQIWHSLVSNVKYTNTQIHKYTNTQIQSAYIRPNMCYIFEKLVVQGYQLWSSYHHIIMLKKPSHSIFY